MAGFNITVAGDSAINLEFGNVISEKTNGIIRAAAQTLEADPINGVIELVPTFCSLMVVYNPCVVGYDELTSQVRGKLRSLVATTGGIHRVVKIPVCYGGDFGPDLSDVAEHAGMSADEVIAIHSGHDYLIDMLGFLPGFAYLGGLDERLHTPRLATPRTRIEPGAVGIGGAQTGIYPLASPGGWRIIGRTPVRPYDPDRESPILYAAGDYLRFVPITPQEFSLIETQVEAGTYECEIVKGRAAVPVQAGIAGERSEGCAASERSSTAGPAAPQVGLNNGQASATSAGRSEGCEASERSSADDAIAVPQAEVNNGQAAGSAAWSEGCAASERNASEHAAAPQVNAVPQAKQEEEDEDALWV